MKTCAMLAFAAPCRVPGAAALLASALVAACAAAGLRLSPATSADEAGLVAMDTLLPDLAHDIRYAGADNFVGGPVDGYEAERCLLLPQVAQALRAAELDARRQGLRLRVFDCYRPARAVAHFMRWAAAPDNEATRARHHPRLRKSELVPDYIAERSGHSRGAAVDLTLLACDAAGRCEPLDMGTDFDLFDPRANTDSPEATPAQHSNRERLRALMARHGFADYPLEWWHFVLRPEPAPEVYYDVPVRR